MDDILNWILQWEVAVSGILGLVAVGLVADTLFTVTQQTAVIVERFGKFRRVVSPGLHVKCPVIDRLAVVLELRVQQLDMQVETKTQDNVFVKVSVSVQYYVDPADVYAAYYRLDDPATQIKSFVFDVVRAAGPKIALDDVFVRKDEIADAVKRELSATMAEFGYVIVTALVTDIDPDAQVKASMNEINAAQRRRVAANEQGEAERILVVARAKAESESKALQGIGIANQRRAIVDGLRESVAAFQEAVAGASPDDVMALVLLTQYFDMLKEVGGQARSNTILLPHSPAALPDLMGQLRSAIMQGTITAAKAGE